MSNATNTTTTLAPASAAPQSFEYVCQNPDNAVSCAPNCTGLDACMDCQCAIAQVEDTGGPWGPVMDVIFCILPILFLIVVTIKKNPWPTSLSLPAAALLMFLVRVMYLASDPLLTAACVILGVHEAFTPLSIMAGAICLFETMEATYCMPYMMREIKSLTNGHPIAESMLIFAFAYMVEGASGFGTPVALGAPMLVSTGHDPLKAIIALLIFNTFATVWGAVGTPIWFGLGGLGLPPEDFQEISYKAGVALAFCAFLIFPWVLTILVPFRTVVLPNLLFIYLSLVCSVGPSLAISFVSYEFPSLMGGLVGCGLIAGLIKLKLGLKPIPPEHEVLRQSLEDISTTSERHGIVVKYRKQVSSMSDYNSVAAKGKASNALDKQVSFAPSVEPPTGSLAEQEKALAETAADLEEVVGPEQAKAAGLDESLRSFSSERGGGGGAGVSMSIVSGTHHDGSEVVLHDEGSSTQRLVGVNGGMTTMTSALTTEDENMNGKVVDKQVSFDPNGTPSVAPSTTPTLAETVQEHLGPRKSWSEGYLWELIGRTFPIWGVVVLLILTRIEQIGIKPYLTLNEPYFSIYFGTYGTFRMTVSIVLQLKNILTYPGLNWQYQLAYTPFIMPFVLISLCTMLLFRKDLESGPGKIFGTVAGRLAKPAVALLGALTLVQLMIKEGSAAPAFILGDILAKWFQQGFIVICPLLGALGSFFSGSTTVSNLTFADIQEIAALRIGTSVTTMLALQSVGASAGNGICLNNIISACTVVGLEVNEGKILGQTYKFVLATTTIATVIMLAFFFRFA